ncbi:MAG: hypothetical protein QM478_11215 [Flavobacteriaceae bacterium]
MYNKFKITGLTIVTLLLVMACNNPKVINPSSDNISENTSSGIFSNDSEPEYEPLTKQNKSFNNDLHTVIVNEILPTSKYVYLNVNEGDKQFWIATRSKKVNVGETYYYSGGLLKTNFESKEHNRVFEKVYLVSKLVVANHGNNQGAKTDNNTKKEQNHPVDKVSQTRPTNVTSQEGSITIAELVKNPKKYEGQTVQLTGVCTKINAGIMNRNWIHLNDGTNDDFDLVITSEEFVPEGSKITIKAVVVLNKDFGAGYNYDLILEKGELVK